MEFSQISLLIPVSPPHWIPFLCKVAVMVLAKQANRQNQPVTLRGRLFLMANEKCCRVTKYWPRPPNEAITSTDAQPAALHGTSQARQVVGAEMRLTSPHWVFLPTALRWFPHGQSHSCRESPPPSRLGGGAGTSVRQNWQPPLPGGSPCTPLLPGSIYSLLP